MSNDNNNQAEMVHVGNVYMVKTNENFVGLEIGWTENVLNRQGAASVLDMIRNMMSKSGWIAQSVLRAPEIEQPIGPEVTDAQTDEQAGGDSNQDAKMSASKQKKSNDTKGNRKGN